MKDERLWTLMNQQLDSSNSPQEEQALQLALEKHPRARRLMSDAREVWRALDTLDSKEVDRAFRSQILERLKGAGEQPATDGDRPHLRLPVKRRWGVWLMPLAAGVVLGLALGLLTQSDSSSVETDQLFATMGSAGNWTVSSQQTIPGGSVHISRSGDSFLVDVLMEGPDPLEIEFGFDDGFLGVSGLTSSQPCILNAEQGKIRLIPPSGTMKHRLLWVQKVAESASLSLSVFRNSQLLGERELVLMRQP